MRISAYARKLLAAADAARQFPHNTCGASRYTQMIGEALVREGRFHAIEDEPDDVGEALLATVAALYQARTRIAALEAQIANHEEPTDD